MNKISDIVINYSNIKRTRISNKALRAILFVLKRRGKKNALGYLVLIVCFKGI